MSKKDPRKNVSALSEAMHDSPRSVDLNTVSEMTGFTPREIATFLDVKLQTLERSTAAPVGQPSLAKFLSAWKLLQTIFPSNEAIKEWFFYPTRRFHGETPKWLLETHGVDAFEGLAEEMTLGTNG
jgi:hypothetical protein